MLELERDMDTDRVTRAQGWPQAGRGMAADLATRARHGDKEDTMGLALTAADRLRRVAHRGIGDLPRNAMANHDLEPMGGGR